MRLTRGFGVELAAWDPCVTPAHKAHAGMPARPAADEKPEEAPRRPVIVCSARRKKKTASHRDPRDRFSQMSEVTLWLKNGTVSQCTKGLVQV